MSGYRAALESVAVALRPDRGRVRFSGKDPVAMLLGVITNSLPEPPLSVGPDVTSGAARYAAVLTPKGRMVADLRVVRGPRDEEGLLLEASASALPVLLAHLAKYVPPRFAKSTDVSELTRSLTVVGPGAAAVLSREGLGLRVETTDLAALAEGEWRWFDGGGAGVLAIRSGDLATPAFDVVADRTVGEALAARLLEAGAAELTLSELDVLRVEAGRPAWGVDMDQGTLLPETGIDSRAIDHTKGCYTGQEVIVRIRDRGHVNRRLCGLRLGGVPLPDRGAELWIEGSDRSIGEVTSAVSSPRAGGGLALCYLRSEVEVPHEVRLGELDGPRVQAVDLAEEWWQN